MTAENQPSKKVNWAVWAAWIGTVAAVIAAIPIISSYVKTSEYSITATGDAFYFSIPPSFVKELNEFEDSTDLPILSKKFLQSEDSQNSNISKEADNINKDSDRLRTSDLHALYDYIHEHYPSKSIRQMDLFKTCWQFSITNTGSKEITDLTLELPFDGLYSLTRAGEASVASSFDKNIKLGSLRPANIIEVTVWGKGYDRFYDKEKTRVTYPNGIAEIEYPSRVTGFPAWLGSIWPSLKLTFWLLVIWVVFTIAVTKGLKWFQNRRRKPQEEITKTEEKVEVEADELTIKLREMADRLQQKEPPEEPPEEQPKRRTPRKGFLD